MKVNTIKKGIKVMIKSGESFVFNEEGVVIPDNLNSIKTAYIIHIKNRVGQEIATVQYDEYPNSNELIFEIVKADGAYASIEEIKELTYNTMHHYVWGVFLDGLSKKEYCWENKNGLTINVGDIIKVENTYNTDTVKVTKLEDSYSNRYHKSVLALIHNNIKL